MKFHWGNGIVLFFILFLTLCGIFIVFSLRQNNDLVSEDYYKRGADFTGQIHINQRSAIYTDSIQIVDRETLLLFELAPGIREQADSLQVFFFRPSDKSEDFQVSFALPGQDLQVRKDVLIHGRYKLRFSWTLNGLPYEVAKLIDIR